MDDLSLLLPLLCEHVRSELALVHDVSDGLANVRCARSV
jgi:hypothetical protein